MTRRKARAQKAVPRRGKEEPAVTFYVVGLGASAGGLEALRGFFSAVPAQSGAAFVVIQHLAPDHPSQMVELIASHTSAPVEQIEDGATIRPDHVYVVPPGKCVKIVRNRLLLFETEARAPHLPIDHFFRSLAEECGPLAIGVSLSGTGSDGTLGVRAIKEAGGTVMVQDATSAKFSGMPDSAGATGLADYVLPPAQLARQLLLFIRHPLVAHAKATEFKVAETTMSKILALIREQTSIDFSGYKESTVMRRIRRRIGIAQLASPENYLEFLQQSPQEVVALGRDLLINVTKFFRDAEVFAALRDEILPAMLEQAAARKALRIWVPGCGTGEEAYSIAMLVQGLVSARRERWDVKIFATDLDKLAIDYGSRGAYPKSIAVDVAPELLARYFVAENELLRICTQIREQVVFAKHNILRDPPFTKADLVSCRNLLIYLRAEPQKKVITLLHFALQPVGYLVLGITETIGDRENAFETVNPKMRIFRKRGDSTARLAPAMEGAPTVSGALEEGDRRSPFKTAASDEKRREKMWERVSARVMAELRTTCLVLNSKHEIVHSFGEPERFLTVHSGHASLSVLKLVPRALSLALSSALCRAAKEQQAVHYTAVPCAGEDAVDTIDLKVEPIAAEAGNDNLMLVFLHRPAAVPAGSGRRAVSSSARSKGRMADLQADLESTKDRLEDATEDKETVEKELKASHEELMAGNEELQSSNEELESVNEELTTLNNEFQQKIADLVVANNDLENLMRTSGVATIFLDEALRLRRFTPAVTREISLQRHDIGRVLTEFSHPLIAAIAQDLPRVAGGGEEIMKTIQTRPELWHLVRITPYLREGASDRGLVVTILDVTALYQLPD